VTPTELVYQHHPLPYPLYKFQREAVDESAERERTGLYFDVGTGKSCTATAIALYKKITEGKMTLVVMPPILITMWSRWLAKIPGIACLEYRGSPKKRAEMSLQGYDFILMSMQIFKKDYDHLTTQLRKRDKLLIVDEATAIKNVESDNHLAVAHLATVWEAELLLLTGTPLSTPIDAYAYIKLIAPGSYRTLQHFENVHVESRDIFDKITEWRHLDLIAENMRKNSIRVLREDVLKDLPPVTHTPLVYELSSRHYALYKKLATEELLEMEAGGKIDATNVSALFHALQQIILNPEVFSEESSYSATGIEMLDEIMDELGDKKLVIFTNYRMTNVKLEKHTAKKYGGRTIYGGTSNTEQQEALDEFVNNPACRTLTLQVQAGGMGIDNLQTVCSDMLFMEFPTIPSWYHQAVARLHRNGQRMPVNVRVAIAEGTTQPTRFHQLMDNDQLVNTVIRNFEDLRAAVFSKY
jgi:SNF2 family DNA or RNA helicase